MIQPEYFSIKSEHPSFGLSLSFSMIAMWEFGFTSID